MENSTLDGKIIFLEDSEIRNTTFSNSIVGTIIKSKLENVSDFTGHAYIYDSTIKDSKILGPLFPNVSGSGQEVIFTIQGGTVTNNSTVGGYGLIQGSVDNSTFDGLGFTLDSPYITQISPTGSMSLGSEMRGNSGLSGKLVGAKTNGISSSTHRAGIGTGITFGPGATASNFFKIEGRGSYNQDISNEFCRIIDEIECDDWGPGFPPPDFLN